MMTKKRLLLIPFLILLASCTKEYKVTFVITDDVSTYVLVAKDELVKDYPTPTKEGYIFLGWYEDEDLTIPFDFVNTKITKNTKLYAKWERSFGPLV